MKKFPLTRGERCTFSLFERKRYPKEANQRAAGLLVRMEAAYRKARSLCAIALGKPRN